MDQSAVTPQPDALCRDDSDEQPLAVQIFNNRRYLSLKCAELDRQKEYLASLRLLMERFRADRAEAIAKHCRERRMLETAQREVIMWKEGALEWQEKLQAYQADINDLNEKLRIETAATEELKAENSRLARILEEEAGETTTVEIIRLDKTEYPAKDRRSTANVPILNRPNQPCQLKRLNPAVPISLPMAQFPYPPYRKLPPTCRTKQSLPSVNKRPSASSTKLTGRNEVINLPAIPEAEPPTVDNGNLQAKL